jgi:hypothetical protein
MYLVSSEPLAVPRVDKFYLRSSMSIVSMVKSRFHCARHGSFDAST